MSSNLVDSTSSNEKGILVRGVVLHFLIMYLLTLLVEDLVRLPYLRTSGRTEEFTLTRPCVNLKKKVTSKSSGQ